MSHKSIIVPEDVLSLVRKFLNREWVIVSPAAKDIDYTIGFKINKESKIKIIKLSRRTPYFKVTFCADHRYEISHFLCCPGIKYSHKITMGGCASFDRDLYEKVNELYNSFGIEEKKKKSKKIEQAFKNAQSENCLYDRIISLLEKIRYYGYRWTPGYPNNIIYCDLRMEDTNIRLFISNITSENFTVRLYDVETEELFPEQDVEKSDQDILYSYIANLVCKCSSKRILGHEAGTETETEDETENKNEMETETRENTSVRTLIGVSPVQALKPFWEELDNQFRMLINPSYDRFINQILSLAEKFLLEDDVIRITWDPYYYMKVVHFDFPKHRVSFGLGRPLSIDFLNAKNTIVTKGGLQLELTAPFSDAPYIANAETKAKFVSLLSQAAWKKRNLPLRYDVFNDSLCASNTVPYNKDNDDCDQILREIRKTLS